MIAIDVIVVVGIDLDAACSSPGRSLLFYVALVAAVLTVVVWAALGDADAPSSERSRC